MNSLGIGPTVKGGMSAWRVAGTSWSKGELMKARTRERRGKSLERPFRGKIKEWGDYLPVGAGEEVGRV